MGRIENSYTFFWDFVVKVWKAGRQGLLALQNSGCFPSTKFISSLLKEGSQLEQFTGKSEFIITPVWGWEWTGLVSQLLSNLNDYDSVSMIQTLSLNKNSCICQQISDPYLETVSYLDAKFLQIILRTILRVVRGYNGSKL